MFNDVEFYKEISGLTDEELKFPKGASWDCCNCFKPVSQEILDDCYDIFDLKETVCEHCEEYIA